MYKKPNFEVMDLKTVSLMQSVTVSAGSPSDPASPPVSEAPVRGDIIE